MTGSAISVHIYELIQSGELSFTLFRSRLWHSVFQSMPDVTAEFERIISIHSDSGLFVRRRGSSIRLEARDLIYRTMWLLCQGWSVEQVVSWLGRLVSIDETIHFEFVVLPGHHTMDAWFVADGLYIVPIANLREALRLRCLKAYCNHYGLGSGKGIDQTAVIVSALGFAPMLETEPPAKFPVTEHLRLPPSILSLSCEGRLMSGFFTHAWSDQAGDPFACEFTGDIIQSASRILIKGNYWFNDLSMERVRKYLNMPIKDQRRILLSAKRWGNAVSSGRIEDRFLDLCIGLEILLSHSRSDSLSYKISRRAARLLGAERSGQVEVCRQVQNVYDARSRVAHDGTTKAGPELLERGIQILERSLLHMLDCGRLLSEEELDFGFMS